MARMDKLENGLKEYLLDKEINLVFNMVHGADRGYQEIGGEALQYQQQMEQFIRQRGYIE